MVGLTYATYVAALANMTVYDAADANFTAIIPSCINYAEQRIYRELDILNTVVAQTGTLTTGTRNFTLPTGTGRFVVTNAINVITPSTETSPDGGTRNAVIPVSIDFVNAVWPSTGSAGLPQCYAMLTDQTVVFGPFPDAAYTVEVLGTIRPTPLSESNTTTYLSLYLPDLFLSASMVFMSGYQQNFGSQADNPQMSASWEAQYKLEFASANTEEQRKRYASGAWGSLQPTSIATPGR